MPTTTITVTLVVLVWNVLGRRFDYGHTWPTRLPRVVARIRAEKPDVLILTECQAAEAKEVAAATGYRWANYLGSSILYRPSYKLGRRWALTWLTGTHGALIIELSTAGRTFNVVANHLPPFAWRASYRKKCVARLKSFMAGWSDPTIVGGDFNWTKTLEAYVSTWLVSLRLKAARITRGGYRTSGKWGAGNPIDYLLGRKLTLASYIVQPGTDPKTGKQASDHHLIIGTLTTTATGDAS